MFVEAMLDAACDKLVTVADDVRLIEVARLLTSGADLVAVCDGARILRGVVTKTNVVRQIGRCEGATCMRPASSVTTRDVALCRLHFRVVHPS